MLKAVKEQFKSLAKDENKVFHNTLRRQIGKKATALLEERLKKIIVLMPDLIQRIHDYWRIHPDPSPSKKLGSYILTYLYLPKDFLPDDEWGLYGYLDDAYMVAKIYTTIIEDLSSQGAKVFSADKQLYEEVILLKKSIRVVLPKVCEKVDNMVLELSQGKQESFFGLVNSA